MSISILATLIIYNFVQVTEKPIHKYGHIIDLVIARPGDSINTKVAVIDSLYSQHHRKKTLTSLFLFLPLSHIGTLQTMTVHHLSLCFPAFKIFLSVDKANQFYDLWRTVLDTHSAHFLQKVSKCNSFSWFESRSDDLLTTKKE